MEGLGLKLQEVTIEAYKEDMDAYNVGLFNTWQWVGSLTNEYTNDIYFHILLDGEVVGKLCGLAINQGNRTGTHLYFNGGPDFKEWTADVFRGALILVREYAKSKGYARLHFRPYERIVHDLVEIKGFFHTRVPEYVIYYDEHQERVKFSYGFKQNAKKARKAGAVFHTSKSPEILDNLFALLDNTRLTRKDKYGKDYDPMYLLNLDKEALTRLLDAGIGVMHYAEIDGVIHSVQFNLEHEGKIFGLLMGSDNEAYSKGIPSFIDMNISDKAMEENAKYYNIGSVPLDDEGGQGLKKYKESQSGRETFRYGYYSYFLSYPHRLLNPFIKLSKKLPNNRFLKRIRSIIKIFSFTK